MLYPDKVKIDLNKEVKTFYSKVYLDNNVTDDEINQTN
jgi:iron complex transport system substrate-binding protein